MEISCQFLTEKMGCTKWLCIPNSRLVVNPADVTMPLVPLVPPQLTRGAAPLHLGYYVGNVPARLPFFFAWHADEQMDEIAGPVVNFSCAAAEKSENMRAKPINGKLELAVGKSSNYGWVAQEVTVDLDRTPWLVVNADPAGDAKWAMKVSDGNSSDIALVRDTSRSGELAVDIREATGWSGKRTFLLRMFVIDKPGARAVFTNIRFVGANGMHVQGAIWSPAEIVTQAASLNSKTEIETSVSFYDEDTISQLIRVKKCESGKLVLVGLFAGGEAKWDAGKSVMILQNKQFCAAVAVSKSAKKLPGGPDGIWKLEIDNVKPGDEIAVAAKFMATPGRSESADDAVKMVANPAVYLEALNHRIAQWNHLLSRVPQPKDFYLRLLNRDDATPEAMERMYYKAWVFLLSNTLPPTPEMNFNYQQVSVGKPSLWTEGHPTAPPSCQWESFIAMQFMAEIEPEFVWSAYEGMLSLVDEDGTFAGEGLPSRHAQTAWILYEVTKDSDKLRRIYPALKRLLLWKARDPRWVYKGMTPEGSKDSEFVVHALLDMLYTQRICGALDMPQEKTFWQEQVEKLRVQYEEWFWETKGGTPWMIFQETTGERKDANYSWNLQGLALPQDVLGEAERESLLKSFRGHVNDEIPYLIRDLNKFPSANFTLRGVWQYGEPEEAMRLAEASLSAVTLADGFAECYSDEFPVTWWGVAPSVFGAASVIDSALWLNGVALGYGLPIIVHTPGAAGVTNLLVRGEPMSVMYDGDEVEICGKVLKDMRVPHGFSNADLSDGGVCWRGTLAVGEQLVLEEIA